MKKLLFLIALGLFSLIANSQTNFSLSAKSDDTELDASLTEINAKAKADLHLFKNNLSIEFNVGERKIEKMFIEFNMSPADAYMTLEIAKITQQEPESIMNLFSANKNKGWGVIAKEAGIKPGSQEFHALKSKAKDKKNNTSKGNNKEKGKGKK